ncbi:C45 family autoproteolytic acyltransferase/hydrolase [Agrobacterium sp. NPDC058088]|uniref:C45 family autoproteolytic acyltransferase/hydolase n=1 Tax=Agrobacterium sp. NPDC058088 TaxID=3346335 RepID=UPI0036D84456
MLTDTNNHLPLLSLAGSAYDIGVQLGRHGARSVHGYLKKTQAWATVINQRNCLIVEAAKTAVAQRYPTYLQELQGLSEGLELPFDDVFAWNCRGDVWAMAPDGCTTVQMPGPEPIVAHNEDGDPGLRGGCAIVRVTPNIGKAYSAFVYPASIPGHTFAVNENGLVLTVNNIRSQASGQGLPRMILTRAILDCGSVDEAASLISKSKRAGAFHLTLACAGDARIVGVEFTHKACSVHTIGVQSVHANHLVHDGMHGEAQIITGSSQSRQCCGDRILARTTHMTDPMAILWDQQNEALPVYRDQPDDPDDENTLATAVFEIKSDNVAWRVYDRAYALPRFSFEEAVIISV